MIIIGDTLVSW